MKKIADISLFESLGNSSQAGVGVFNSIQSVEDAIQRIYDDFVDKKLTSPPSDELAESQLADLYYFRLYKAIKDELAADSTSEDVLVAMKRCSKLLTELGVSPSSYGEFVDDFVLNKRIKEETLA